MKLVSLGILFLILMVLAPAAKAEGECFKQIEAEAEQGIRIHSELMVIGLNCQHKHTAQGKNLYTAYRDFTQRHLGLFAEYENVLINYFQRSGDAAPVGRLNALRTNFANKISNDAATMRPDMFCKRYAPRIAKAASMSEADIRSWASTFYPSHPVSKPLCPRGDIQVRFGDE